MSEDADRVEARVLAVVSRVMNVPASDLSAELHFVEDLEADSLRVMELVLELQEEFGIEIPDEDLERIRSVGQAISYMAERSAPRPAEG